MINKKDVTSLPINCDSRLSVVILWRFFVFFKPCLNSLLFRTTNYWNSNREGVTRFQNMIEFNLMLFQLLILKTSFHAKLGQFMCFSALPIYSSYLVCASKFRFFSRSKYLEAGRYTWKPFLLVLNLRNSFHESNITTYSLKAKNNLLWRI